MTTLLDILQHALGRDEYGRPKRGDGTDYRNHFTTGEGGGDLALCRSAVAGGLMAEHAPREISGGEYIFTVTDRGRAWVTTNSPAAPRLTRAQTRYQAWLAEDSGDTFGEWLRRPRRGPR